jgi:hypothetical protein
MNQVGADITVFDRNGQIALMAEVEASSGTNREWAAMYRRNLAADHFVPKIPFFMIATRDRFYIWKNPPDTGELIDPDYEIDPQDLLEPYFRRSHLDPQTVSGLAFEVIVSSWLFDLQNGLAINGDGRHTWLEISGLLKALRGGRLVLEGAAEA